MRKNLAVLLLWPLLCISCMIMSCSSFFAMKKKPAHKTAIAMSLRELTTQYFSVNLNDLAKKSADTLCGMNKILGYMVDPDNKDIIIIGERVATQPNLQLDDFAVLLRNAVNENEPPGCSIDPRPEEMDSLHALMAAMGTGRSLYRWNRLVANWQKYPGYQSTRVLGIEKTSHAAKVLIDADYLMKKIANGSYRVKVKGFKSFAALSANSVYADLQKKRSPVQQISLNRFWFYPTRTVFRSGGNIHWIDSSSVKLLTEQMMWTQEKTQVGSGQSNPTAEEFVNLFSVKYEAVSEKTPVYSQLEALFRLYTLQRIFVMQRLLEENEIDVSPWLKAYTTGTFKVPDTVQTVLSCFKKTYTTGNMEYHVVVPMAGGIMIKPEIDSSSFQTDTTGKIRELENAIKNARPVSPVIFWLFPLS